MYFVSVTLINLYNPEEYILWKLLTIRFLLKCLCSVSYESVVHIFIV